MNPFAIFGSLGHHFAFLMRKEVQALGISMISPSFLQLKICGGLELQDKLPQHVLTKISGIKLGSKGKDILIWCPISDGSFLCQSTSKVLRSARGSTILCFKRQNWDSSGTRPGAEHS